MSRPLYLNGAVFDGTLADFSQYQKLKLAQSNDADSACRVDYVDSKVLEQTQRIDALLAGSNMDLNNLKEISDYVNSLDEVQRLDILLKVAQLNATIQSEHQEHVATELAIRAELATEASTRSSEITAERTRAELAELALRTDLAAQVALEATHKAQSDALRPVYYFPQNHATVYADGSPAIVPASTLQHEQGWYYKKASAVGGKKHNWYLEVPAGLKLKDIKTAQLMCKVMETTPLQRDGEVPYFGFYTKRLADGKDRSSWYRSRITFSMDNGNSDYKGKHCFSIKLDASREHIPCGDYSRKETTLAFNSLLSTGSATLADCGEEEIQMIHVSSNSTALTHAEYFVHFFHMQLADHTASYRFNGNDVCDDARMLTSETNLAAEVVARNQALLAEATARTDGLQQEATARDLAVQAEANARALKDGEHDAALLSEQQAREAEVQAEKLARETADQAETAARESAVQAEQDARTAADLALTNTVTSNKATTDLFANYVAEIYKYFNQTYESVYAFNHPVINEFINNSAFTMPPFAEPWEQWTPLAYIPDYTIAVRAKDNTEIVNGVVVRKLQVTVHLPRGLNLDGRWVTHLKFEQKRIGESGFSRHDMPHVGWTNLPIGYVDSVLTWYDTDTYVEVEANPHSISVGVLAGDQFRCSFGWEYVGNSNYNVMQEDKIKYSKIYNYVE